MELFLKVGCLLSAVGKLQFDTSLQARMLHISYLCVMLSGSRTLNGDDDDWKVTNVWFVSSVG